MYTNNPSGSNTSGTGAVAAISPPTGQATIAAKLLKIYNPSSSGAGFFSLDGGTTWDDFPAGPCSLVIPFVPSQNIASVMLKRNGSTDLAAVTVTVY